MGPEQAAPPSPGDEDLGEQFLLKRPEKPTPFRVYSDVTGNYTSNVLLQPHGGPGDTFLLGEVGASWSHLIAQNLGLDIGVRQQFFRYNRYSALDFDALNVGAGVNYALPKLGGIVLSAAYSYDRMVDRREQLEFYTNHALSIGAQKTWILSRAHNIFVAYNSAFSVATDPSLQRRNYHSLSAGYNVDLTRHFSGQFVYRLTLSDYSGISRQDLTNLVALGFSYKLTSWANVSAMGSYIFNDSTRPAFDYQAGNLAANLGFSVKF